MFIEKVSINNSSAYEQFKCRALAIHFGEVNVVNNVQSIFGGLYNNVYLVSKARTVSFL